MDGTQVDALRADPLFRSAYDILEELGQGSFARVFHGRQRSTGRDVAIKLLRLQGDLVAGDSSWLEERFKRELRVCADISHPNVVRLLDCGETDSGILYAVFEHVPGVTLKELVARQGKLQPAEAAHLMGQVLDGLSSAHGRGIVHRDLTPSNIMIARTGVRRNAFVLDFGLGGFVRDATAQAATRITAAHELIGTPCYAAPEQLRGEPPSPASDLYSWGLILLECLTGELAVRGASAQEVILRQLGPEPITIPRWLADQPLGQVIGEVIAKRADDRTIDVARLLDLLSAAGGTVAAASSSVSAAEKLPRSRRQVTVSCFRLSVAADGEHPLDVEEVDQALRGGYARCADHAIESGATVVAMLADRAFVVHGYQQAREGDARRATQLALETLTAVSSDPEGDRSTLRCAIHVGIHTGLVVVAGESGGGLVGRDLIGPTPTIASRLADLAGPGELLVSGDTRQALRDEYATERVADCSLRELSRPMPAYRVDPVARRRPNADVHRTPLVGRDRELARLREAWHATLAGRVNAIVMTGEAGIGKSRLLRELRKDVGAEGWTEWRCTAEGRTTPLRPVADALAVATAGEPLEALLARVGMDVEVNAPLLEALLSGGEARLPVPVSAERQKEFTLDALLTLLYRLAQREPLVLAIENLHWADPTTLELATLLTRELDATRLGAPGDPPRLLLLATTRPEFLPSWPAESFSFLPLQRLGPDEVEALVRAGLDASETLPPELLAAVRERAEGVPLFAEELARVVLDVQRRHGSGTVCWSRDAAAEVPTSLRDLLTSRLDGVSPQARQTAQLAAVLGREFRYDLLCSVLMRDTALLREDVEELARAGLLFSRRTDGAQSYIFRHALLRDAAYDSLPRARREGTHRRVARVLNDSFPDVVRRSPELLALHHEQGREPEAAVQSWLLAGMRNYRLAAYLEAATQLERGLEVLETLPPSVDRLAREVDLLIAHGTVLLSTRGWAAPEVEASFTRALEVTRQLGSEPPLMVLYGLWGVLILRSEPERLESYIPLIEALERRASDRVTRHFCHSILGIAAFWKGDFRESDRLFTLALEEYDESAFAAEYDGGLYTYAFGFCSLWTRGFAGRARALRDGGLALARRRRDPYSLAAILAFAGMLANDLGEGVEAAQYGEQLMTLANEQRLYAFWAPGAVAHGGGLVLQGRIEEGLRFIRDGLERYRMLGIMASYTYYQVYLTRAYLAAGKPQEALAAANEGLALSTRYYARFQRPELWRLRAAALLCGGDAAEAESSLRRALALAEESGATTFALRAAADLARLLRDAGRTADARAVVDRVAADLSDACDVPEAGMVRGSSEAVAVS